MLIRDSSVPDCSCSRLTTTPLEMAHMPLKKKVTNPALRRRVRCVSFMMFLTFQAIPVSLGAGTLFPH